MFYLPRSLVNFISLLLPLHNFYHFPSSSTILLFSLLHLLIYSTYFSIHKYIDLLSTVHRPYIDPSSTLLSTFFNTASWIVKLYTTTTTTTTFLLFSLHHHHHRHHISIVFPPPPPPPPPPHFYCFPSTWWWWRENNRESGIGSRLFEAIMAGTYCLKRFLKKTPVTVKLKNK